MSDQNPHSDVKLSAVDEQGVLYVLLNDKLPTFVRGVFVVWNKKGVRRLLFDHILSLQVFFRVNYLQVGNLHLDLRKFALAIFHIFIRVFVIFL